MYGSGCQLTISTAEGYAIYTEGSRTKPLMTFTRPLSSSAAEGGFVSTLPVIDEKQVCCRVAPRMESSCSSRRATNQLSSGQGCADYRSTYQAASQAGHDADCNRLLDPKPC